MAWLLTGAPALYQGRRHKARISNFQINLRKEFIYIQLTKTKRFIEKLPRKGGFCRSSINPLAPICSQPPNHPMSPSRVLSETKSISDRAPLSIITHGGPGSQHLVLFYPPTEKKTTWCYRRAPLIMDLAAYSIPPRLPLICHVYTPNSHSNSLIIHYRLRGLQHQEAKFPSSKYERFY